MTDKELEKIWTDKSNAYNNIIFFLRNKGLDEKELVKFSRLLSEYIILLN